MLRYNLVKGHALAYRVPMALEILMMPISEDALNLVKARQFKKFSWIPK